MFAEQRQPGASSSARRDVPAVPYEAVLRCDIDALCSLPGGDLQLHRVACAQELLRLARHATPPGGGDDHIAGQQGHELRQYATIFAQPKIMSSVEELCFTVP